jgi:hypothetical protein
MSERIRWTMSLRERDDNLIEHFSDIVNGDRSAECRRLMYLGLELLEMRAEGTVEPTQDNVAKEKVRPFRKGQRETKSDILNKRLDAL